MSATRHILVVNEFFHPDICASAVVATNHWTRVAALRPDWRITAIASRRAWDDPAREYAAEETFRGVRIVRVDRPEVSRRSLLRRGMGFVAFERAAMRAAALLPRCDLVIGTTAPPQGAWIAAKIARRFGCPYIYVVLDLYPDLAITLGRLREGSITHRLWRWRDERVMLKAARVVSIAERITGRIAQTRPIDAARLATIHDGFDDSVLAFNRRACSASTPPATASTDTPRVTGNEHYVEGAGTVAAAGTNVDAAADFILAEQVQRRVTGTPTAEFAPAENRFRAETNPEGRFVVQYAGNMGLSHPFETIIEGCRLAAAQASGAFCFQFIGDGPQREYVRANLPPGGQLLDYQPAERLGEVLATADVCLISQHEDMFDKALPYKVYGILAAGRPTVFVGNERSEIAKWLRESGAGVHVNQGDAAGMAAALKQIRHDAGRRLNMGAAARRLYELRFRADRTAERWAGLVKEIE